MIQSLCTMSLRAHRVLFLAKYAGDLDPQDQSRAPSCGPSNALEAQEEDEARFQFWALFAKDESAQFVPQLLHLFGIAGIAKALCYFEKLLFFLPPGRQAQFEEFEQHAIAAETASPGDGFNLLIDLRGESHAPANLF